MPDADAAVAAGRLLEHLPSLWKNADLEERRRVLMTMLEAVYVDTVKEKRVVAIRAKPAFRPLFEIATTREGSGIVLVTETPPSQEGPEADGDPCSCWRRGEARTPPVTRNAGAARRLALPD